MILVTGAAGHIGNVLVQRLLDIGESVRALLLPGEDRTPLRGMDIEIREGNVLDSASLKDAFRGIKSVFHLAGMISILPGRNQLVNLVNIIGTKNIIWAAMENGIERLVYTSSIHAFERIPHGEKITENTNIDPEKSVAAYDFSKASATIAVTDAVQKYGLDAVIVCPTGVIGPYDYHDSEMGCLIREWMINKVNFLVKGAYDFVDVRDVANGIVLAYQHGIPGERYILNGEYIKIPALLELVKQVSQNNSVDFILPTNLARFVVRFTPAYYGVMNQIPKLTSYSIETLLSNCDIDAQKTRGQLNYMPRSLRETITDTVRWWREQMGKKKPL